jgi:hypothetical protein
MNNDKKIESLRFLLAAASQIYGDKKIIEMLTEQGAPKHENISQLETRLTELCVIADSLKIGKPENIRKWLSDDCKPCLVEHIIQGYEDVYHIMIELDNRLMWPGWPLIGKLHDPIE